MLYGVSLKMSLFKKIHFGGAELGELCYARKLSAFTYLGSLVHLYLKTFPNFDFLSYTQGVFQKTRSFVFISRVQIAANSVYFHKV